jgi:hypothetical protein
MESELQAERRQVYKTSDDINHPGRKVGEGV